MTRKAYHFRHDFLCIIAQRVHMLVDAGDKMRRAQTELKRVVLLFKVLNREFRREGSASYNLPNF